MPHGHPQITLQGIPPGMATLLVGFLSCSLLLGTGTSLGDPASRILVGLFLFPASLLAERGGRPWSVRDALALMASLILPLAPSTGDADSVFCFALVLAIAAVLRPRDSAEAPAVKVTICWVLAMGLLVPSFLSSPLYPAALNLTRHVTGIVGGIWGETPLLGPTPSGVLVLTSALMLLGCFAIAGGFASLSKFALSSVVLTVAFLLLILLHVPRFFLGSCIALLYVLAIWNGFCQAKATAERRISGITVGLMAGLMLVAPILLSGVDNFRRDRSASRRVVVQSSCFGSFERPSRTSLTGSPLPRFGALPIYLRAMGYEVLLSGNPLESGVLDSASLLAVFNPRVPLGPEGRVRLHTFLQRGGTLLLVGDHTNVGGILVALNSFLQDSPLRFRFDTAISTYSSTSVNLATGFPQHPLRGEGRMWRENVAWGTGASLEVRWPGCILFTMKEGFSDEGDPHNGPSFLGNYRLDPGELAGDIPLLALSRVGHGRVVVFGDTGLFQDPSLFVSASFVDRVFAYATGGRRQVWPAEGMGAILAAAGLFLLLRHGRPRVLLATCALLYLLSIGIHRPWARIEPHFAGFGQLAVYDLAHAENIDRLGSEKSVQTLNCLLLAKGYLPVAAWARRSDLIQSASLILVLDPKKPFSSSSAEQLLQKEAEGGIVLMCVGSEQADNAKRLLSPLGLAVSATPLGSGVEAGSDVVFDSAFGINVLTPGPVVVRRLWGYAVVVCAGRGRGRSVLISDSQFVSDANLSGHAGNIALLDSLLTPGIQRPEPH